MTSNVEPPNYHHHHHPHMYNSPWAHYYHRGGWYRRGGNRFIWFLVGAGAATWYHHRRGSCDHHDDSYRWRKVRREDESLPVEYGGPSPSRATPYDWRPEIDRMKQLGRQASNKVVELGDAGLESALSAVAMLRLKLREAEEKARVIQEQSRSTPPSAPVNQSSPAQNSSRPESSS